MSKSKNLALTILMSIIISGLIIGFVNVGISLFLDSPEYRDYCDISYKTLGEMPDQAVIDQCSDEYENAQKEYNRIVFYILSGVALALLMIGLFVPVLLIQIIGMASGGFLAIEAIIRNLDNQWQVFVSIGVLIVIAIYFTIKKLKVI